MKTIKFPKIDQEEFDFYKEQRTKSKAVIQEYLILILGIAFYYLISFDREAILNSLIALASIRMAVNISTLYFYRERNKKHYPEI